MAAQSSTVERLLARLAGASHGVVTRRELLATGVTRHEIARRLRSGALIAAHPGVYRVGHRAPSTDATYMAAVKACGEGALLGGLAAAYHLGLIRRPPSLPEVIAPTWRRIDGIRTRRSRHIDRRDATTFKHVPVTTVGRTMVDIAARLSEEELALAFHRAGIRHDTTPQAVEAVLERRPNSPCAGRLRRVVWGDADVILSKLEKRFRERLNEAGLLLPVTNRPAGGRYVDCRWPNHKLTPRSGHRRSSSTRTATTGAATPSSRTAAASGRPTPAATTSAATSGATCSRTPG